MANSWETERTETENVILKRRSVRYFQKKQVPAYLIKRIIEVGRFAPSAGNCQPWKFIVLRDPEIIAGITQTVIKKCQALSKLLDYRYRKSFLQKNIVNLLIRFMPNDLHPVPFGAATLIAQGKLKLFHDAPTVILIFKDVRGIGDPSLDCGIAGQNMVIAAHSMGLGTCWVGFAKLAFTGKSEWKKKLNIGYPYEFSSSLVIGYPVGRPDKMVPRVTTAVDWYEDGAKKTFY